MLYTRCYRGMWPHSMILVIVWYGRHIQYIHIQQQHLWLPGLDCGRIYRPVFYHLCNLPLRHFYTTILRPLQVSLFLCSQHKILPSHCYLYAQVFECMCAQVGKSYVYITISPACPGDCDCVQAFIYSLYILLQYSVLTLCYGTYFDIIYTWYFYYCTKF